MSCINNRPYVNDQRNILVFALVGDRFVYDDKLGVRKEVSCTHAWIWISSSCWNLSTVLLMLRFYSKPKHFIHWTLGRFYVDCTSFSDMLKPFKQERTISSWRAPSLCIRCKITQHFPQIYQTGVWADVDSLQIKPRVGSVQAPHAHFDMEHVVVLYSAVKFQTRISTSNCL